MEAINIKELGEKKRHVKINDNVFGPTIQNLVVGLSISLVLICIKLLKSQTIDEFADIKFDLIVGILSFAIVNIFRFLLLDEGLLFAYKTGMITANSKNNIANIVTDFLNEDSELIDESILNCAKRIIKNHFSGSGIDYRTLQSANFTRTQIDKARSILLAAKVIRVENNKTIIVATDYKSAMAALRNYMNKSTKG